MASDGSDGNAHDSPAWSWQDHFRVGSLRPRERRRLRLGGLGSGNTPRSGTPHMRSSASDALRSDSAAPSLLCELLRSRLLQPLPRKFLRKRGGAGLGSRPRLDLTQEALSVTQRYLGVTQRAVSATQQTHLRPDGGRTARGELGSELGLDPRHGLICCSSHGSRYARLLGGGDRRRGCKRHPAST